MNILVCLKQILDPDLPARDFRIDGDSLEAARGAADLVPNIFCENAVETALQLRDACGGVITVLSYGTEETEDALRKTLAMKADAAALVLNDGHAHPDPLSVARVLAAASRKLGDFDLIMVGRESGDWGVGQTGGLLAEELGTPFIALADRIEVVPAGLRVRRQTDGGYEVFESTTPLVVSITNSDQNLPRIPKTRDVMKSYRKPMTTWTLDDLELGETLESVRSGKDYYSLAELAVPEKEGHCDFVDGDNLEQKIDAFARKIAEIASTVS